MTKEIPLQQELEKIADYNKQKTIIIDALEYLIPESLIIETNNEGKVKIVFEAER